MGKKKFKTFKGDIDIFVPKAKERNYLASYGMEVKQLPNGALLAAATRQVADTAEVKVNVHFPHASYYEPVGKRGLSHLVEHFIFNKPHFLANEKEAYYNAYTYPTHMELVMRGRVNPQVKDHGILPVVPTALEQVTQPLEITETTLKSEKNVVLGELYEYLSGGSIHEQTTLFEKTFFSPEHPHRYNALGTKGDILGVTIDDVKQYHKQVFVPQGMLATVFVDGSPKITRSILQELEKRMSGMPRRKKPAAIDLSLFNKINPRYKQGALYKKASKKQDNQVKIHFVWLLPKTDYSVQAFADSQFFDLAQQRMFQSFRKKGLGYTAEPVDEQIGEDKRVMGFVVTVARNKRDPKQLAGNMYENLKKAAFEQFTDDDIKTIIDTTKKRSMTGISIADRFSQVLTGLKEYGRIIDAEKVQELDAMIMPEHLRNAQKKFLSTPPTVLIEGDLS